jgi:hypothetical protein
MSPAGQGLQRDPKKRYPVPTRGGLRYQTGG